MNCIGCNTPIPPGATQCPMCTAPVKTTEAPTEQNQLPSTAPVKLFSTKICPKCSMEIRATAIKCPYCRSTVGMSFLGKCVAVFMVTMVGSCVIGKATAPKDRPQPPIKTAHEIQAEKEENTKSNVKYNAKRYVELYLKAPSTAKFPYYEEFSAWQTPENKDVWEVTGYVDAQNSFGAMIRSNWYVKIHVFGDSYQLVDIKIPYP